MSTILDKIVKAKVEEIANAKANTPINELKEKVDSIPAPIDFRSALLSKPFSIIAEIKKSSPSKGLLAPKFDPV